MIYELTHSFCLVPSCRGGSQSSKDAHSRGNNKRSYLVHCLCSQQRSYLKFFFLAKRAEWEWFHILALGVPTLHGVTRVMAFILDPEKTVVLFLQMHLMVVRCFCENCSCELPDGCVQHSCCGIFEKLKCGDVLNAPV